jgi:alkylhydroperoxidase family enzyme
MAYISYSKIGNNPLTKLLGHNPVILKNWVALLESFYQNRALDRNLKEEVRRTVAHQIGCAYCTSQGSPTPNIEDIKTKTAVDFAKKVIQTQKQITKQDIELLEKHFSEKEIAEVCAYICCIMGLGQFGAVLNVDIFDMKDYL